MSDVLAHVPEYTCQHGEPPAMCPAEGCPHNADTSYLAQLDAERDQPRTFADSLLRRSALRDLPQIEPLVTDLISLRSTVVLVGPTGAGKTIVGMSLAGSVGTGSLWLGREVTRVPVLYVVGEGAYGLDNRLSALERTWGYQVGDQDVVFAVKPGSLHLHQTWAQMTEAARELGVRFVVLDTFSSLAPEADETKDAPRITRWMSDLSVAIDGTAMLVHHPGWGDQDRPRGGYQLEANVDEVLLLRGNGADPVVSLERKKVKDGPAGARLWLRRMSAYGSVVVEEVSINEAVQGPLRDRIVVLLRDLDQATGPQLCAELGARERAPVYRALRDLVKEGAVIAEGKRGRQKYSLSKHSDG